MSGVAPIGHLSDFQPRRKDEEVERMEKVATQPPPDEKPLAALNGQVEKEAEKTTLYSFKYTGKGSFIDKIF